VRESHVEEQSVDYAKTRGWMEVKLDGNGNNGKPDRVFLRGGVAVFIEFKAPGEPPSRLQVYWCKILRKQGFDFHLVDNIQDARKVVDSYG